MDMTIRAVRDPGDKHRERVVLHAEKDLNVGLHMLLATMISSDGQTLGGRVPFCYWFPNSEIKSGELVVVYSKQGRTKQKLNKSGNISHFFYWGLEESIWQSDDLRPVLVEIVEFKSLANSIATAEEQEAP